MVWIGGQHQLLLLSVDGGNSGAKARGGGGGLFEANAGSSVGCLQECEFQDACIGWSEMILKCCSTDSSPSSGPTHCLP